MALPPQPLQASLVVGELAHELHERVPRFRGLGTNRIGAVNRGHCAYSSTFHTPCQGIFADRGYKHMFALLDSNILRDKEILKTNRPGGRRSKCPPRAQTPTPPAGAAARRSARPLRPAAPTAPRSAKA